MNKRNALLASAILLLGNINCFAASAMVQQQRLQELNQTNAQTQQVINNAQQYQQRQQQHTTDQLIQLNSNSNNPILMNPPQTATMSPQKSSITNNQPQQSNDYNNQAPPDITGFAKPSNTQQDQNSNWNYGL